MRRRMITRSLVALVVLALLSGCGQLGLPKRSGSAPAATTEEPPAAATPSGEVPAPRPVEPAPTAPVTPAVPTVNLREQLALRPAPSVKPSYKWALPPEEEGYLPLPTGLMLTHPRDYGDLGTGKPFFITARKTDGRVAWHYDPGLTDQQIARLSLSSYGDRLVVVEWEGRVTILNTWSGERIATLDLPAEEASLSLLTNAGLHLAVPKLGSGETWFSGATLYPVDQPGMPPVTIDATSFFLSPHHDQALVVVPEGVEVKNSFGSRGIIKSSQPQDLQVLHISGDGNWIFLWGDEERLLYSYERSLKQVGQPTPVARWSDLYFPTYAPLYYHGQTAIWMDGRTNTLDYDATAWWTNRVLAQGERVLYAPAEKVECVVTPTGTLFGCLPWLESHRELGTSFFWTADEESVLAYLL